MAKDTFTIILFALQKKLHSKIFSQIIFKLLFVFFQIQWCVSMLDSE